MMKINFAEQDEAFIQTQIRLGVYRNATELVQDAVRKLREHATGAARLTAALDAGERDLAKGRVTEYTPDFMANSIARARQAAASGQNLSRPDVIPF